MKKNLIIHPWLFALIPIIGLFEHNQDIASAYYLPKPLLITLAITIGLFFILNIFIKNKYKSAIIISAFVISFFFFDLLTLLFFEINDFFSYSVIPYQSLALVMYIISITGLSFVVININKNLNNLNKILNFFAFIVILLQLFSIANYQYQHKLNITNKIHFSENLNQDKIRDKDNIITETKNNEFPDIYYIILDGYGRADTLNNIYNYDNSPFLNFLEEKGFYIAEQSTSNYNQTFLSLSSSLNLNYLDEVAARAGYESGDRSILKSLLKDNLIYDILKEKNYTFVSLPSTWTGTYKNIKSDITLINDLKQNSFNTMLIKKTPLVLFFPSLYIRDLATYTNSVLDKIPEIANIKTHSFSYIHILSPHPPFVFEADGNIVNKMMRCIESTDGSHYFASCPGIEKYRKQYIDQLSYLSTRFENIVTQILEKSETPPIIILQGDHGPGSMLDWESAKNTNMQERFPILNAYYVPAETKKMLYPSISPVNSFRIIFNSIFDNQFEILEDKNYFATWDKPYKFIDVSNKID